MILALYLVVAIWLSLYGLQSLILIILYIRHHRQNPPQHTVTVWPTVAVQLPIFNERHVVERLIDSAAELDYPHDRLTIQVLDDSIDDTTAIAERRAARWRACGVDVRVLHRVDRSGFKAGALAEGLKQTRAEFVAIFDADFRPNPDFLRRTLPHLLSRPELGAVQARWAHLNDLYSPLTRAQSLLLDGHFVVEQTARNRGGLLMSFNGSGGIWRRRSIEESGGWQSDTMTEDLDLSYRAQMVGWQFLYLPDVETPSELPPQMEAFKQQQARWAQGSIQCMRKLGWSVLRGDFTWFQKLMALLHMSAYLTQPLVIFMLLASLPVLLVSARMPEFLIAAAVASLGAPMQYTIGQSRLHGDWERRMLYLPVLAVVGIGSAWSTTRAVWTGLTSWGGTFGRTPKFRIEGREGRWRDSVYRMVPDRAFVGEIFLALYAIITIAVALAHGNIAVIPYLTLYAAGFGYVAFIGIQQKWQRTQ